MAFTLLIFLALLNAFIFIYFKQKTLQYKILTSIIACVLAILLFYIVVIFLWRASENPAEERLLQSTTTG
jgi:uncharacterized membrane-anchored protein